MAAPEQATVQPCLMAAWHRHEGELRHWLQRRLAGVASPDEAEDMLQELFLKALRQGERFCALHNARAWLFEVARNALADRLRVRHEMVELPEDLSIEPEAPAPVDSLASCLPRALAELDEEDREALVCCDLEGMTQAAFAQHKGLSLPGAKSRVQRARKRLRAHLTTVCQVRFDAAGEVCCFVPRPPAE
ncbi:sigma-70 family RNA polymerase sigma factor [Niveibacterium sp. 24ML]|uniref:sigma-70 family RNA polymerase sigma factor n=1 Tax=Niveibacterium sp. 24ML TaxID=2985512 RepID=UPI0022702149|nr:sigma-70 family RNA polymerase sigma factor [Niveibacterium sp. 24ML]MCX9154771.1 sigma-70 family RNA polymerase sigma factor [Niveibacterium sp. 24ML]